MILNTSTYEKFYEMLLTRTLQQRFDYVQFCVPQNGIKRESTCNLLNSCSKINFFVGKINDFVKGIREHS